ncbi:MAG: hypothetical protein EHM61_09630 [Acidobacteria bacterium]|nr:MAG: hypothetical protein EHM61_09630 [Acidobacteriota bacterium]
MAKSYPAPGSDPEKGGAAHEPNAQQRTVGVYDRPKSRMPSRLILTLILVGAALLVVIFIARSAMAL